VPCECHVVDGEAASLPVDDPLARHYPESAVHRIAVTSAPSQGRVVTGDKGPGVHKWHRVYSDQGSGGRSQDRVAGPAAGTAALPHPLLPDQP
jgi:hypothetical protein